MRLASEFASHTYIDIRLCIERTPQKYIEAILKNFAHKKWRTYWCRICCPFSTLLLNIRFAFVFHFNFVCGFFVKFVAFRDFHWNLWLFLSERQFLLEILEIFGSFTRFWILLSHSGPKWKIFRLINQIKFLILWFLQDFKLFWQKLLDSVCELADPISFWNFKN